MGQLLLSAQQCCRTTKKNCATIASTVHGHNAWPAHCIAMKAVLTPISLSQVSSPWINVFHGCTYTCTFSHAAKQVRLPDFPPSPHLPHDEIEDEQRLLTDGEHQRSQRCNVDLQGLTRHCHQLLGEAHTHVVLIILCLSVHESVCVVCRAKRTSGPEVCAALSMPTIPNMRSIQAA
eukprot:1137053-Pelagomonas_calceolata.AAC.7